MKIGINGSGTLVTANLEAVNADMAAAEADGFSSYWLAQVGGIDALTLFAARGASTAATEKTSAMELGTAVIPTWPIHPHVLAAQALTTQATVGGRLVLGIGLSHQPAVEDRWKMKWEKPIRQMNDFLDVLQPLLTEGEASHLGHFWSFEGQIPRITQQAPKVMIAALGEQMLRIAGQRTDGTILWCVGPKTIRDHIAPILNGAAAEVGRAAPEIVCSIPVWVTNDPAPARAFLGQILANYAELASYRKMLDIEGLNGLAELSIVGSDAEVADGIAAIAEAGATVFTAVPMGGNPDEVARTRAALIAAQPRG